MTVSAGWHIMWENILVYRYGIFIASHMKLHEYFAKNFFFCRWYGFCKNFIQTDDESACLFLSNDAREQGFFPYPSGSESWNDVDPQFPKRYTYQLIMPPRKWLPLRSPIILASSITIQSHEAIRKVRSAEYLQSNEMPTLYICVSNW
jgi:hypothetical protein